MSKKEEGQKVYISIIIPLYKGMRYCKRLLEMLQKAFNYKDFSSHYDMEVIFVNDFPEEKIMIPEYDFKVIILNNSENIGIHASRVKGIERAGGTYISMLDQDDLITEEWLYSQMKKIMSKKADIVICNGWSGRFRILWNEAAMRMRINDLDYFVQNGNPILSPGQVMIKKSAIPVEWRENLMVCNGADDYLLWIMMKKKGIRFELNPQYLFYHTPERTINSVGRLQMMESLREALKILRQNDFLDESEMERFNQQIVRREHGGGLSGTDNNKFREMFIIAFNWLKLKNCGANICEYLKSQNIVKVAIYGLGYLGECLYEELQYSGIDILYGIDKTAIDFKGELPIVRLDDDMKDVDAIIVTVAGDISDEIRILKSKCNCRIIHISQLFIELYDNKFSL